MDAHPVRSARRRLRIIMGEERGVTASHARSLLRAIEKNDLKYPMQANPRGIARHTAHHPILCDDCGVTFWSRDEYGTHVACKGTPKQFGAGFQS